jgi:Dolichyl-phosphate-mannose-protein mannosyltransferase
VLIAIPLILSAFSHIWNPIGFPSFHIDESHYMRRAMQVLEGMGPQDPYYPYDHPYFGQLFLASILKLIGYPAIVLDQPSSSASPSPSSSSSTTNTSSNDITATTNDSSGSSNIQHSIEMLYLVPRVLMGILAVVDTFLVYKISERRYNRNVAFIASVLFAVMPMTWLLRRILLDSILLPFLLSSILFAVYYNNNNRKNSKTISNNKEIITVLLSGIFLGIAIFTKIPAFTMIPLVVFLLVYTGDWKNNDNNNENNHNSRSQLRLALFGFNKKNMKMLGLWLIPVILIPLIWPAYAMSIGQFDQWIDGLYYQSHRDTDPTLTLFYSMSSFFRIDPALLVLGAVGIVFSVVVKRDFMILLWTVPFLTFLYFVGFVVSFHIIPLLPPFCIAAAIMINDLSNKAGKKRVQQKITKYFSSSYSSSKKFPLYRILHNNYPRNIFISFAIVSIIGIFGLISITILITTNFNSSYFKANAFVAKYTSQNNSSTYNYKGKLTIISDYLYLLTPQYLLHRDFYYKDYQTSEPIKTQNVLLVLNSDDYKRWISTDGFGLGKEYVEHMQKIYESTIPVAIFKTNIDDIYNSNKYPQTSSMGNWAPSQIEIRTNILPSTNPTASVIQINNTTAISKTNHGMEACIPINEPSILPPYWNDSVKNCGHLFTCMVNSTTGWTNNRNNNNSTTITATSNTSNNNSNNNTTSFQISTNTTNKDTWSWIQGNEINVKPAERYQLVTHMKSNQYATQSHVAIQGYNQTSNKWYHLMHQCKLGANGPLEWHEFKCNITIPKDTTKIRLLLNAGWSSQPGKQAITLFDDISLKKIYLNRTPYENKIKNTTISTDTNMVSNPDFVARFNAKNQKISLPI